MFRGTGEHIRRKRQYWRRAFLVARKCCSSQLTRGVLDTWFHNVMKCDVDISKFPVRLCLVIMFQGTGEHITNKLMSLAPSTMQVQVVAPPE